MSVGRICNREVQLVEPNESAAMAAIRMRNQNVGTLVVLDNLKKPIGIVTDRDLVVRVMALGKSPHECLVDDVMTHSPKTLREDAPIEDTLVQMCGLGLRRMIVVDEDGRLIGIVSLDDILSLLSEEVSRIGRIVDQQSVAAHH